MDTVTVRTTISESKIVTDADGSLKTETNGGLVTEPVDEPTYTSVEMPQRIVDEIIVWAEGVSFDDEGPYLGVTEREFGEYGVLVEDTGSHKCLSIAGPDNMACLHLDELKECSIES